MKKILAVAALVALLALNPLPTIARADEELGGEAATSTESAEANETDGFSSPTAAAEIPQESTDAEVSEQIEEIATTTEEESGGGVEAAAPDPSPSIVSGRAVAVANILNILNTNVVNSEGAIVFANLYDTATTSLDFRDLGGGNGSCSLPFCGDDVALSLISDAYIENLLELAAVSGRNVVDGGGAAAIQTGDAYACANVVNIANANIIDSDYLLLTLNAFSDVDGDIIFPSFSSLDPVFSADESTIALTSDSGVENDISVAGESGTNAIEADTSSIETGDALGSTNVFNQINTDLIGGASAMLLFRIHGDWDGDIFGLPDSVGWSEAPDGSIFLYDTGAGAGGTDGSLDVAATSTALIKNDLSIAALTGENTITGSETGLISTGDAYACANVANIANTNVIGQNWIRAIINIFGDFNGNISFGMPDLWVGAQVAVPAYPADGDTLTYTYTVINNGDAPASDIVLVDDLGNGHLDIIEASTGYEMSENGLPRWHVGRLEPEGAFEVTLKARIKGAPSGTSVTDTVTVSEHETDGNFADNTDMTTVTTALPPSPGGPSGTVWYGPAAAAHNGASGSGSAAGTAIPTRNFSVQRHTAKTALVDGKRAAHQELVLANDSGLRRTEIVFHDIMRDPDGRIVSDEIWDLGTLETEDELLIEYDLAFAEDAPRGQYSLASTVESLETGLIMLQQNGIVLLLPPAPRFPTAAEIEAALAALVLPPAPLVLGSRSDDPAAEEAALTPAGVPHVEAPQVPDSGGRFPADSLYYALPLLLIGIGFLAARQRPNQGWIDSKD